MSLEENQVSAAARLFSKGVLLDLARNGRSPMMARLIKEAQLQADSLHDVFENAFGILKKKNHRHEYVYKAALTHKVLLGTHSLRTASMLSEFRVGSCKADYAILNGTSTVYEIKSERDSLTRLENQISAYQKVFAKVNVIVGENHVDSVYKVLPRTTGILTLSSRHQIQTLREAVNRPGETCSLAMFEAVQSVEALKILEELGIILPKMPNTELHGRLRSEFSKLPAIKVQTAMVKVLKNTRSLTSLKDYINQLPPSLQPAILSTPLRKVDYLRLLDAIKTPMSVAATWR